MVPGTLLGPVCLRAQEGVVKQCVPVRACVCVCVPQGNGVCRSTTPPPRRAGRCVCVCVAPLLDFCWHSLCLSGLPPLCKFGPPLPPQPSPPANPGPSLGGGPFTNLPGCKVWLYYFRGYAESGRWRKRRRSPLPPACARTLVVHRAAGREWEAHRDQGPRVDPQPLRALLNPRLLCIGTWEGAAREGAGVSRGSLPHPTTVRRCVAFIRVDGGRVRRRSASPRLPRTPPACPPQSPLGARGCGEGRRVASMTPRASGETLRDTARH
jgi:hypothetical protein